jgi:4-amino-4-deoxy-L-arabinose transferase-like glycosyltransferase
MRRALLYAYVACLIPRLIAGLIWPTPRYTYHWELSQSLLRDGVMGFDGRPTTYLEPLYPLVLAGMQALAHGRTPLVLVLQAALAASGGVALFLLADRIAGRRAAWFATLAYACSPYLVRQSASYLALSLTIPLTLTAVWSLARATRVRDAAFGGILFGLLMLTRASFGLPLAAAAAWLAWRRRPAFAAALVGAALAVQAPWLVRNARVDGSLLPTRIGENLLVSTAPYTDGVVPIYDVDVLVPIANAQAEAALPSEQQDSQQALDAAMLRIALRFIATEPWHAVRLKLANLVYVFDPLLLPRHPAGPNARAILRDGRVYLQGLRTRPWAHEIAQATAQAAVLLLGAIALAGRRLTRDEEVVLVVAAANALTCVIFFPTTRLLAPTSALLMVWAGAGAARLLQRGAIVYSGAGAHTV